MFSHPLFPHRLPQDSSPEGRSAAMGLGEEGPVALGLPRPKVNRGCMDRAQRLCFKKQRQRASILFAVEVLLCVREPGRRDGRRAERGGEGAVLSKEKQDL